MPGQPAFLAYLFGPLLTEELTRFRVEESRSATLEQQSRGDVPEARLSFKRFAALAEISLPAEWSAPIPKAHGRNRDGGYSFVFERRVFAKLQKSFRGTPDPFENRLISAIRDDRLGEAWHLLFAKNQGAHYSTLPSYQSLLAGLSVVLGAIELFICRQLDEEGPKFIRDAPRMWRDLDTTAMSLLASKYGISTGVVLASVIQLAARSTSPAVRIALDQTDPAKRSFEALENALWKPLIPTYQNHPYFRLTGEKSINPAMKGKAGRPSSAIIVPAPDQLRDPEGASAPPQAPAPTEPKPRDTTADIVPPTTKPPAAIPVNHLPASRLVKTEDQI